MKFFLSLAIPAVILCCVVDTALASKSELDWMLGCWAAEDGNSNEVWVRQTDQQMIGFSVAFADGRMVFHELLSIQMDAKGAHYTAHPQGQPSATFSSSQLADNSVSFTKPDHDYPQRIDYHRDGDELRATISLLNGSEPNTFTKQRCK